MGTNQDATRRMSLRLQGKGPEMNQDKAAPIQTTANTTHNGTHEIVDTEMEFPVEEKIRVLSAENSVLKQELAAVRKELAAARQELAAVQHDKDRRLAALEQKLQTLLQKQEKTDQDAKQHSIRTGDVEARNLQLSEQLDGMQQTIKSLREMADGIQQQLLLQQQQYAEQMEAIKHAPTGAWTEVVKRGALRTPPAQATAGSMPTQEQIVHAELRAERMENLRSFAGDNLLDYKKETQLQLCGRLQDRMVQLGMLGVEIDEARWVNPRDAKGTPNRIIFTVRTPAMASELRMLRRRSRNPSPGDQCLAKDQRIKDELGPTELAVHKALYQILPQMPQGSKAWIDKAQLMVEGKPAPLPKAAVEAAIATMTKRKRYFPPPPAKAVSGHTADAAKK